MAEQEKNYLDIEATAAQVKKGIEEVVNVLTNNVRDNNNKFLSLELDEDGLPDDPTDDDLLSRVSLVLKTIETEKPTIESQLNELLIGDGNGWAKTEDIYYLNNIWMGDQIDNTRPDNGAKEVNGFFLKKKEGEDKTLFIADAFEIPSPFLTLFPPGESNNKSNVLQIGENSHVLIRDKSDVKIGRVQTDRSSSPTRVHIFDGAKVDIDGGVSRGGNGAPEVFLHGDVKIHIDDGVDSEEKYTGENSVSGAVNGSILHMHDKSFLSMNKGSSIIASNMAQANFYSGFFAMQSEDLSDLSDFSRQPTFVMNDGSALYLNGGPEAGQYLYHPFFELNGGSTIIFNASDSEGSGGGTEYDPLLLADPTGFTFIGQGSAGAIAGSTPAEKSPDLLYYNTTPFGSKNFLVPSNKNPRIKISDETMIMVDAAQGGGANWIKIGADNDGLVEVSLTGNIFQQMEHNAHSEMHHNSKFIMRGLSSEHPWEEDGIWIPSTDSAHLNQDWTRPIHPIEQDSPILGMYDVSQFIMRGVWDNIEPNWKLGSPAIDTDRTTAPSSFSELTINEKDQICKSLGAVEIRESEDDDNKTTFSVSYEKLWITNIEYHTKPLNWQEHLNKIENQPVVEIIENADVRIYGNSELKLTNYSIIADSNGFTFKDNSSNAEGITFSMEDLNKLKQLLENSTTN